MVQDLLTQLPVLHVPASAPVAQPDTGATTPPVVHILISEVGYVPVLQVPVQPVMSFLAYVPLVQVPAAPQPKLHVAGAEAQLPVEQVRHPVLVSKEKTMIRGYPYRIRRMGTTWPLRQENGCECPVHGNPARYRRVQAEIGLSPVKKRFQILICASASYAIRRYTAGSGA
jgi:hypothetical protein